MDPRMYIPPDSMTDASADPIQPGQQYAMDKRIVPGVSDDPFTEASKTGAAGLGRGAASAGPGKAAEILPPKGLAAPDAAAATRAQFEALQQQELALMRLRPMVPSLIKLGVTPEQMVKMDPKQAYQFIKERSPQGFGTVDRHADRMVGEAQNTINAQRRALGSKLLGGD